MSWNLTVPPTAKDQFDAAVDIAEASGQDAASVGLADDVAAAKSVLKALAKRVKRDVVGGSAGGHCLQPTEGNNWSDSLTVGVYGVPTTIEPMS